MTFVRVRDKSTGHQYDLPESDPRITAGLVEPVSKRHYKPSSVVRRPKYNARAVTVAHGMTAADGAAEKEATHG